MSMPQQPCRGVFAGLQGPNRANRGRTGWSKWACLRARHRDRQRYHDFRDRSEAQTGSARPITILARIIPLDLDHTTAAVRRWIGALVPRRNYVERFSSKVDRSTQ